MENAKNLDFLRELLTIANSARTPQQMLDAMLDRFIGITGAATGSIMLIDPDEGVLVIKAYRGLQTEKVGTARLKIGEGVTGRVAATCKPLLIPDVEAVDFYVRLRDDLKSELAVPLKLADRIVGVVSVDGDRKGAFTQAHLEMLTAVSDFTALILFKENLVNDLRGRVDRQALLLEVAGILEEDLSLEAMFRRVMAAIAERIAIERGMLVIQDPDDRLRVFDGYRLSEDAKRRGVYQIGEGIVGRVHKSGKGVEIRDVSREPEFLNRMKIWRGRTPMSFYAVPLRYENKTVGVLSLERPFASPEDSRNVYELSTLIAAMISNRVHLHVKTEREKEGLRKENRRIKDRFIERESGPVFIGNAQRIREILATVDMVADTGATVLVTGETGTGKELIAGRLHFGSSRWDKPFVSLNCAAIPQDLLESELFGHRKGAFTGADRDRKGRFLQADGGTIFLDEIGDLDFRLQAKILRVLQERVVEPVGAEQGIPADVRVVVATNKDLKKLVAEGKFREDLLYRINVISVHLPPLRERRDDIPLLADFFLRRLAVKYGKRIDALSPDCMAALMGHSWPGNIRELQNAVERAVILSSGGTLEAAALPAEVRAASPGAAVPPDDPLERPLAAAIGGAAPGRVYDEVVGRVERILVDHALVRCDNKQTDAAAFLGIHRNTLAQKIRGGGGPGGSRQKAR